MSIKRSVTLRDIANELGFSVNTISCALKGKGSINKETAAEIKKKAAEMGYIPNGTAASMRTGKTNTVAVIIGDIANAYFSIMVREIERKLRGFGYITLIFATDEDEDNEYKSIITALEQKVDAIILFPVCHSATGSDLIRKAGIPFVLVGRHLEDKQMDYVISDDKYGGYIATNFLLKKGHRRILNLSGPSYISCARERYEGYIMAHNEMNVDVDPLLVMHCDISLEPHVITAIDEMLSSSIPFSAVFAFSDLLAFHVCNRLRKYSIGPIEIIGYDNLQSHINFGYDISSIDTKKVEMANRAVEIIMERMNSGDQQTAYYNEIFPVDLVLAGGKATISR